MIGMFAVPFVNAHRVFAGTDAKPGFKKGISLEDHEWRELIATRDLIRRELRRGFAALNDAVVVQKALLLEKRFSVLAKDSSFRMTPRFRMQGSFSYRTVNKPAWVPPQEIDLDDGVYLPTSFTSQTTPVIAARGFFDAVERMLRPVCEANDWKMAEKSSCVRIIISQQVHLDLPLYTIPDEDFHEEGVLAKADGIALDEAIRAEIGEQTYRELPKDRIMLALRDGTWMQSDPRKMDTWFQGAVNEHGQHLRRSSRYLKAWRDLQWPTQGDGMSSICLMKCAVTVFDQMGGSLDESRDDLTLNEIAGRLPGLLAQPIANPVVAGLLLDCDWTAARRAEYIARAEALRREISAALSATEAQNVIGKLRGVFGDRIPNDASLITIETTEARILSTPPRRVPAPTVLRSTSG